MRYILLVRPARLIILRRPRRVDAFYVGLRSALGVRGAARWTASVWGGFGAGTDRLPQKSFHAITAMQRLRGGARDHIRSYDEVGTSETFLWA